MYVVMNVQNLQIGILCCVRINVARIDYILFIYSRIAELRNDLSMQHNRTGDQLRKKTNKKRIFSKTVILCFSIVRVNDERDLLKSKETYP